MPTGSPRLVSNERGWTTDAASSEAQPLPVQGREPPPPMIPPSWVCGGRTIDAITRPPRDPLRLPGDGMRCGRPGSRSECTCRRSSTSSTSTTTASGPSPPRANASWLTRRASTGETPGCSSSGGDRCARGQRGACRRPGRLRPEPRAREDLPLRQACRGRHCEQSRCPVRGLRSSSGQQKRGRRLPPSRVSLANRIDECWSATKVQESDFGGRPHARVKDRLPSGSFTVSLTRETRGSTLLGRITSGD